MQSKLLALLAAVAVSQAVVVPTVVVPEPSPTLGPGPELPSGFVSAKGGALDLPAPNPTAKPDPAAAAGKAWAGTMTITFANHDSGEIRIAHRQGAGSPSPLNPFVRDAHVKAGGQEVVRYPRGYHGAAFLNKANLEMTGQDETVIEMSFLNQNQNHPVGDVDVSYVNGFSRAASCVCRENKVTAGCSKDLWKLHHCPNDNRKGSCKNPKRLDDFATSPTEFFSPCNYHGGAFTFPRADANTLNQRCPSENYWCCIGTSGECAKLNSNPRK